MSNLIIFPGSLPYSRSRGQLVDEISDLMMKEILAVFVDQKYEPVSHQAWYREVRSYFWRQEIQLVASKFKKTDLTRWTNYWRNAALDFIRNNRVRN